MPMFFSYPFLIRLSCAYFLLSKIAAKPRVCWASNVSIA